MPEMSAMSISKTDPVRQFDWYLNIPEFGDLELSIEVAFLPNLSVEEIELPYRNSRTWVAGKGNIETGTITCRDVISDTTAQRFWDWYIKVYNPETGEIGYTDVYKEDGDINTLDSMGVTVARWNLSGLWPQSVNFGTLDFSANDVVKIETTLRYDRARLLAYNRTH